jgi:hypothetical protein
MRRLIVRFFQVGEKVFQEIRASDVRLIVRECIYHRCRCHHFWRLQFSHVNGNSISNPPGEVKKPVYFVSVVGKTAF